MAEYYDPHLNFPFLQSNKLSELLSMVPASSLGKSKIVWRGFLATILLLLGAGCDISPVIGKLKPIIANVLHELGTTRDAMQRRLVNLTIKSVWYTETSVD